MTRYQETGDLKDAFAAIKKGLDIGVLLGISIAVFCLVFGVF